MTGKEFTEPVAGVTNNRETQGESYRFLCIKQRMMRNTSKIITAEIN